MATITTTEQQLLPPGPLLVEALAHSEDPITSRTQPDDPNAPSTSTASHTRSRLNTFIIVFQLCTINFLASFTSGIITVGLPTIALALSLPRSLYLWPSSVYGLASGSTLLLSGCIADLIDARNVELTGCLVLSIFTLACGFAQTGVQLVVFRALQGVALSMHLPASVGLVAAAVPKGKGRNLGFACLGLSQPLGFSAGLVISGVMIERAGWRSGFWLSGGLILVATVAGGWALPDARGEQAEGIEEGGILVRLWTRIDWIGGIIASAGLALLSYVLASLSADLSAIHKPTTAVLLSISCVLLISFPVWMNRRERKGKPTLIPNGLWRKTSFTCTCIMVTLSYGVLNSFELFSSLYFQEIQHSSLLFTSLRLLPSLLVGTLINLTVGLFVDKVPARWLVAVSSLLCAAAPLLMALVNPDWSYWYMAFWAQVLSPMSVDVLFTVGLLIVSDEFPEETQALAGAVFNTVAQFGMSLGLGVCQVVSFGVGGGEDGGSGEGLSLLKGYQASFWTMFACMVVCGMVAVAGLRKAGRVGVKRD